MAVTLCSGCPPQAHHSHQPCQNSQTSYEGAVLAVWERNGSDDSDFYATVWDAQAGCLRDVQYATTRSWTYHNNVVIDATSEVHAAAMEWYRALWVTAATSQAYAEARQATVGRAVRSLITRGKNVGVTGTVRWRGEDSRRSTRWHTYYRVGVKVDGEDGLRYLHAERVEVLDPKPVDADAIRRRAARLSEPAWAGVLRGIDHSATAATGATPAPTRSTPTA